MDMWFAIETSIQDINQLLARLYQPPAEDADDELRILCSEARHLDMRTVRVLTSKGQAPTVSMPTVDFNGQSYKQIREALRAFLRARREQFKTLVRQE